jgi:hypothetical protein
VLVVACLWWWALCWLWGACVGAPCVGDWCLVLVGGASWCWLWNACGGGPCVGCGVPALVIGGLCWLVEGAGVACGVPVGVGLVVVVGCLCWCAWPMGSLAQTLPSLGGRLHSLTLAWCSLCGKTCTLDCLWCLGVPWVGMHTLSTHVGPLHCPGVP